MSVTRDVETAAQPTADSYQPLVVVFAAVATGIVFDRYAQLAVGWWWLAAMIAWLAWWRLWSQRIDLLAAVCLLASLAGAAAAWHHCRWSLFEVDHLRTFADTVPGPAALEVRATSGSRFLPAPPFDPLRSLITPDRTRVEVELVALRDGDIWRAVSGGATLLVDGRLSGVRPGDRLRVFGQLAAVGTGNHLCGKKAALLSA